MNTYLYFIQGEDVALKTVNNQDDITKYDLSYLDSYTLPLLTDFESDTQAILLEEMVYFEVISTQEIDDTKIQDKHAVINAKNVDFLTLVMVENDKNSTQAASNTSSQQPNQHTDLVLKTVRSVIGLWQTQKVYNLFKAMQVLRWYQDHSFCSRCGNRTSQHHKELAMVCHGCHYHQYPRLQPCIIVAITREIHVNGIIKKQILLAKDRRFKRDMQSVIAGFVEVGETLEQAVQREVREETALEVKNIHYLGSQPWAFPSNLMIAFHAEYASGQLSLDDDELILGNFYDIDDLPTIPTKGTISHEMIMQVCTGKVMVI